MPLVIDLLRHGEPVGGRRYRGQVDDPLSEKGWSEMHAALGDACPWTHLVTSPLLRCRAFADVLAARCGLAPQVEPRLREVGFGVWEGHTAQEIETRWPGALARFKADPVHARPERAEPLDAFFTRVSAALDECVAGRQEGHLLIICHAGVIRMALAWALALPLDRAYRVEVPSAGLTRLRFDAGRASLVHHGLRQLPR